MHFDLSIDEASGRTNERVNDCVLKGDTQLNLKPIQQRNPLEQG